MDNIRYNVVVEFTGDYFVLNTMATIDSRDCPDAHDYDVLCETAIAQAAATLEHFYGWDIERLATCGIAIIEVDEFPYD